MKRAVFVACAASLVIAVPTALGKPSSSSIFVTATQKTVVFGWSTTISGRVSGTQAAGAAVTLEAKPYGSSSYSTVQSTFANSSGNYSFTYYPTGNVTVRTVGKASPTATSPGISIGVRPGIGLYVSTLIPRKGQKVGFAGQTDPAFDGMLVRIQRRTPFGEWTTVAIATLTATTPGSHGPRSQYSKRLQINRSGTFRVLFPAPKGWVTNSSRTRTLRVH
jgi:hypothetical protein